MSGDSIRLGRIALLTLCPWLAAVLSAATIVTDKSSLVVNVDPGHSKIVSIVVSSSGAPLTVTPSVSSGATFLAVVPDPVTTPASIGIYCDGRALAEGTYNGAIQLTASGADNSPLTIPLTLIVGTPASSGITVDQSSLTFTGQVSGSAPASQQINVSSSPSGVTYSVAASSTGGGGNWLSVAPSSGTTPGSVTVSTSTTGLSAGSYSGTITLTPSSGTAVTVSVTLNVTTGPALSASPSSLTFTGSEGGSIGSQQISVTSSPTGLGFSVSTSTTSGSWLQATQSSASAPSQVTVSVQTTGLTAGTYTGTVTLTPTTGTPISIGVTLTLTASSPLSASPTSLSFSGQVGTGDTPASQQISITATQAVTSFSVSYSPSTATSWLQVSPLSATPPATLVVSVNTAGLAAGIYAANVNLTPSSGLPLTIPVTLTLTSGLTVSTGSLQFSYQVGTTAPSPQTISVGGISGLPFTVLATTNTAEATGWLSATPSTGTVPQTVTVSVSPTGISPGVYHGNVRISSVGANAIIDIPVTLTLSSTVVLSVGGAPTTYYYQPGKTIPDPQTVAIGSPNTSLAFTAVASTTDGANWLSVNPTSGTTPQSLTISVAPAALGAGGYSGRVTVTAPGASNSPVVIPVTLVVTSSTSLLASTKSVVVNYQIGGTLQVLSQPVSVSAIGDTVTVAARTTTASSSCTSNWLQVFPASLTTPGSMNVVVDPLALATPRSCLGSIVLLGGGAPLEIPVTANSATTPFLNIQPQGLIISALYQSDLSAQTVDLTMTDKSAASFTLTTATDNKQPWLYVSTSRGTTPSTVTIGASAGTLPIGTYTGTVTVSSAALPQPQQVPVTLDVKASTSVTATPNSLVFEQVTGGAPPAAKTIALSTSPGSQTYTAQVNLGNLPAPVLSVTPATGVSPGVITVGMFSNSLPAGAYTASISISIRGAAAVSIPVTIRVSDPAPVNTLSSTPTSLAFSYQQNGTVPDAQQVTVSSSLSAADVISSVSTNGSGSWLTVFPGGRTTPGVFLVSVTPTGLNVGTYTGTVTFTISGGVQKVTVPVSLQVQAVPPPAITAVANVASGERKPIAPGEIVMIFGSLLGPQTGVQFKLNSSGKVDTLLSGTTVLFDEVAAPLLYVSAGQINAIVPYEVSGRSTVSIKVKTVGGNSDSYTIQMAATAPGLFTSAQSGKGQGAILNEDNTVNSSTLPAAKGSLVQVFGTGEGLTQPLAVTGSVTDGTVLPVAKVTATVGGLPADVVFAGAAPKAVAGLLQVNLRIPANALKGDNAIVIQVGQASSQPGVTVSVK